MSKNKSSIKTDLDITVETICANETYMVTPKENLELDLNNVEIKLSKNYDIAKSSNLYVELKYQPSTILTIVKSGSILVKGIENADKAKEIFFEIITKILT